MDPAPSFLLQCRRSFSYSSANRRAVLYLVVIAAVSLLTTEETQEGATGRELVLDGIGECLHRDKQIVRAHFLQELKLGADSRVLWTAKHTDMVTAHALQRCQSEFDDIISKLQQTTMPRIIHQTWKTKKLPKWAKTASWARLNPMWKLLIWDDEDVAKFIRSHFPKIWAIWHTLLPVEKADVFRYAVVHVHGGVYADLDVECIRSIDSWPQMDKTGGIVGVEGVAETEEIREWVGFVHRTQYCQWTFAFVPGHELLHETLEIVLQRVAAGGSSTLIKTGPGAFTTAVMRTKSKDVTILSGNAFACCGGYSNSPNATKESLVRHSFIGSWKDNGLVPIT